MRNIISKDKYIYIMFQNIILIILLILLFFFISNEKKINEITNKDSIKYLFLLVIVYFIYQNYNLVLLITAILILIFFNMDFKEKFLNNKYLSFIKENFIEYDSKKNTNLSFFKQLFGKENNKELFSGENVDDNEKSNKIEPFKDNVQNIKDLFDNIKMEIKKLM